ncbi:hypothetical protein ABGB16_06965 [Micromonospora sp. B11E3]|uniref:hypothetical protein n=1 Tax=Micromonospora sp. B11E3 TaxID=3153562 RepID=UPI00325D7950
MTVQTFSSSPLIDGQLSILPKASLPPQPPEPVVREPSGFAPPVLLVGVPSGVDAFAALVVVAGVAAADGDSDGTGDGAVVVASRDGDGAAVAVAGPVRTLDTAAIVAASIATRESCFPDRLLRRVGTVVLNIDSRLTRRKRGHWTSIAMVSSWNKVACGQRTDWTRRTSCPVFRIGAVASGEIRAREGDRRRR